MVLHIFFAYFIFLHILNFWEVAGVWCWGCLCPHPAGVRAMLAAGRDEALPLLLMWPRKHPQPLPDSATASPRYLSPMKGGGWEVRGQILAPYNAAFGGVAFHGLETKKPP